jgi:hypothetical protein
VNGTWQFPVNSASVTGARKIYIPVETKDGSYTITFTVKALDPQATALTGSNVYLTSTKSVTLAIDGSMYQDDATGDFCRLFSFPSIGFVHRMERSFYEGIMEPNHHRRQQSCCITKILAHVIKQKMDAWPPQGVK